MEAAEVVWQARLGELQVQEDEVDSRAGEANAALVARRVTTLGVERAL
jgi:hypothetical protein